MQSIDIHPEVVDALKTGRAVVALETAVVTHGLPREPGRTVGVAAGSMQGVVDEHWNDAEPLNLETAHLLARSIRARGAIPAVIGVHGGRLVIGLDDAELHELATDEDAMKVSSRDLAAAMVLGRHGGTTVAGTLQAVAAMCRHSPHRPIRVMATGGIGGVHRDWAVRPDISADLSQLAQTPVCVVCSGAKSLLDIPATLDLLDSLRIAVVGFRTDAMPRFLCAADPSHGVPVRVDDPLDAARLCAGHWESAAMNTAVLIANPPPAEQVEDPVRMEEVIRSAEAEALESGIDGPRRTPFVLGRIGELTGGRSIRANIALLRSNAELASEIALTMSMMSAPQSERRIV